MGFPVEAPSRVGAVVAVGRAMFKKPAIAVEETAGGVLTISKGEEITIVSYPEFDAQPQLVVPGPDVQSAAGRLWRAAHAAGSGAFKASFSGQYLDRRAWDVGRRSTAAVRASILDRLTLGLECDVSYLPVSPTEMTWYRGYTAAAQGHTEEMLDHLSGLPGRGYDARCELILARSTDILADTTATKKAIAALIGIASYNALASALVGALNPNAADLPEAAFTDFAHIAAARSGVDPAPLVNTAVAISRMARIPALSKNPMPHAAALDAYSAGRQGADVTLMLHLLTVLPLPCVDELIDAGAITRIPARVEGWAFADASYFRTRLSPGEVDESDLQAAGFTAERARRAYLRADRAALNALDGTDPDVIHYRALSDLNDDQGGRSVPAGLRPDVAAAVATTRALNDGDDTDKYVPASVLSDPTLWPLLQKAAGQGRLRPAEPSHPDVAKFQSWSDLCALQGQLFDHKWQDVVVAGTALAGRIGQTPLASEALNMAAFASLQLGRIDDGVRLLDRALSQTREVTGLLINGAVLASSRGSAEALPYLAKIVKGTDSQQIRAAAITRACRMWLDDDGVRGYPHQLATLVHDALADDIPDDLLLQLCKISAYNDSDWFATANIRLGHTGRQQVIEHFQAVARLTSMKHDDTFAVFCRALVKALRIPNRPAWVADEYRRISEILDQAVHCRYGEALGIAMGIDVLVQADVLELSDRIYLGPQAAAHMAVARDENGDELPADVEARLANASIDLFRRRRPELTPELAEFLQQDMTRSLQMVIAAFWNAASREQNKLADRYNSLNAGSLDQHVMMRNRQRMLLDDFENAYIARGNRLLAAIRMFNLDHEQTKGLSEFDRQLREWHTEFDRLRRIP